MSTEETGHAPGAAHDAHADAPDAPAGHGDAHGDAVHGDTHAGGHGHDEMGLGPVDVRMWATGLLGVILGLAGVISIAIATGYLKVG